MIVAWKEGEPSTPANLPNRLMWFHERLKAGEGTAVCHAAPFVEAAEEIELLRAALTEMLAPRAGEYAGDGASVMIRHRHAAKQYDLTRTDLPDNGVNFTVRRRAG